jgi:hypothetical protein
MVIANQWLSQGVTMGHFMDAKTIFFVQSWEEAVCSSVRKHRFLTHTKQELECFERKHGKGAQLKKPFALFNRK